MTYNGNSQKLDIMPMTTICPKCSHVRQVNETTTPDWQCPACSVVYAKVGDMQKSAQQTSLGRAEQRTTFKEANGIPWSKLLFIALVLFSAWRLGNRIVNHKDDIKTWIGTSTSEDLSVGQLTALATNVKDGDVVMYTTTECQYCVQAKSWLQQYGFIFVECNMSLSTDCQREFASYGANGTPFLLVRGKQMKNGFDSDEFIALLKK